MAGKLHAKIMRKVCDKLAEGISLNKICAQADMPGRQTVLDAIQRNDDLYDMYERARAIAAEVMAEEIMDLARKSLDNVDSKLANAEVQKRRLEIETLKWTFARQQPRGLRNKAADVQPSQVTISWSDGVDDVTARDEEQGNTPASAKIISLIDNAS